MDDRTPDNTPDYALNQRLDRAIPPHTTAVGSADADPLVRTAQRVAQGPDVVFTDAALDRIEARLQARLDVLLPRPAVSEPPRRQGWGRWAWRYAVAAALGLVLVLLTAIQASASSLPGDQLYPVKRALEDIRLLVVPADDEAALRVTLAERRVDEFEALLARGRIDAETLDEAHDNLTRALDLLARGAGDWSDVAPAMRDLAAREVVLIDRAAARADDMQRARLDTVTATAAAVQQRIEQSDPDAPPAQPTPEFTSTPIPTLTPRPTLTSTPIPTPIPTLTPRPSFTPSQTPSPTLSPILSPTSTATVPATLATSSTPHRTGAPTIGAESESTPEATGGPSGNGNGAGGEVTPGPATGTGQDNGTQGAGSSGGGRK